MSLLRSLGRTISMTPALLLFLPGLLHASLVSQNLGAGAYSASSFYDVGLEADKAFDGNPSTVWNSGGYPTRWIEVNLGRLYDIAQINLLVEQSPAGDTEHQIWLSSSAIRAATPPGGPVAVLAGNTVSRQLLLASLGAPVSAQYVQIRTVVSPSWVAWAEIEVYDSVVPVPAAAWLFGTALVGLAGFAKRGKAGQDSIATDVPGFFRGLP